MSAIGGKADVHELPAVCPLIARSGHHLITNLTPFRSPYVSNPSPRGRRHRLPRSGGRTLFLAQILQGGSAVTKNVQRRLAAIFAADVVGYGRLMGEDEAGKVSS